MAPRASSDSAWKRVGWLLLIWCASVLALGAVAWVIRLLMLAAGMRPT
jgi:hypothetical protein